MAQYRKKPVVIDAVQYRGRANLDEVFALVGGADHVELCSEPESVIITTLEGVMRAMPGDWIIKGVKGEFYPCKPDIFAETYQLEPEATA